MADDLTERVAALEKEVAELRGGRPAARDIAEVDLIYRPPIWVRGTWYSATDDRTLLEGLFLDGVINAGDLKVGPRAEGANMSVDVAPGHVVVLGENFAEQGRYYCPLGQKVNVVLANPSGQPRYDLIVARVYDSATEVNPYWQVERVTGTPAATPVEPTPPVSSYVLARVGPIASTTTTITAGLIQERRLIARPAPLGGLQAWRVPIPETFQTDQTQAVWHTIQFPRLHWWTNCFVMLNCNIRALTNFNVLVRTGMNGHVVGQPWPDPAQWTDDRSLDPLDISTVSRFTHVQVPAGQQGEIQILGGVNPTGAGQAAEFFRAMCWVLMIPEGALPW